MWLRWQLSKAVAEFLPGILSGLVCSHRMTYCFWLKLLPTFINTAFYKPSLITCKPFKVCQLVEQLNYSNFCVCQLNSRNFVMNWNFPDHHQMMESVPTPAPNLSCLNTFLLIARNPALKDQHYNFPSSVKISKPDGHKNTHISNLLIINTHIIWHIVTGIYHLWTCINRDKVLTILDLKM